MRDINCAPPTYIRFVMKDIEHYRTLAEANARQTKEEALVFMGGHTQNLILGKEVQVNHVITDLFHNGFLCSEITALRTKISELEEKLQSQVRNRRRIFS